MLLCMNQRDKLSCPASTIKTRTVLLFHRTTFEANTKGGVCLNSDFNTKRAYAGRRRFSPRKDSPTLYQPRTPLPLEFYKKRAFTSRNHFRGTLIDKGHDLRAIQVYMGHKNIQNTTVHLHESSKQFERIEW